MKHYGLPVEHLALTKAHRSIEGEHRKSAWDILLDHVPSDERSSVVTAMKKALDHWLVYRDAVAAAWYSQKRNEAQSIYRALGKELNVLEFGEPVTHVYNPLVYAKRMHNQYLDKFGTGQRVLMLGMNPGPWGMAQTGIPFGEIEHVRDWMGLSAKVDKPEIEHPKRPIQGLDCPRSGSEWS